MTKTIGIPAYKIESAQSFGIGINHLEFASKFGNVRVIMPWEEYVSVDCLYLPGGMDMETMDYGEVPGYSTGHIDAHKEFFFKHRLKQYVEKNVPIFGVCLGMQQLGVYFGSKLTQDLPFHAQSPDRWATGHDIWSVDDYTSEQYKRDDFTKATAFPVNSHHHQGITQKDLVKTLVPLYYAVNEMDASNAIVEAFKHESLPIVGIQWHPEELYDGIAVELFTNLLK